ncbi:MAG: cation transporter [Eggerthellaceae bacterium]|nr:cation transporter [Eggerthellaceae bacterium]
MSLIDQMEDRQHDGGVSLSSDDKSSRNAGMLRACFISVLVNTVLVVIKLAVGLMTNSVAIIGDAINNLADTLSGILTIVGMKMALRQPDYEHPFGYGRMEYVVTVAIGVTIVFSGASVFHDSVSHILKPVATTYTIPLIAVLFLAMLGRFGVGQYLKRVGQSIHADALVASGTDALLDSVVTAATILAAIISMCFGISIEAYLALIIALLIIKAGAKVQLDAISKILGQRVGTDIVTKARSAIENIPGVLKVCDMLFVDFGPENIRGSASVEVDERISVVDADRIARAVKVQALQECQLQLDTVGIHPVSCSDTKALQMRNQIEELAKSQSNVVDIHGFRVDHDAKLAMFDIVVDFGDIDRDALANWIVDEATRMYEDYHFIVATKTYKAG